MGILDNLKSKLGPAKEKVSDLAHQHSDKIDHGLDRAAKAVDRGTKGKYSERIESGRSKAKDAVGRFTHKDASKEAPREEGGGTPPPHQ